jgi:hypothetical protein
MPVTRDNDDDDDDNDNNNNNNNMGTINSSDRIVVTLYCLGTWFVSGIYVKNTLHKGDSTFTYNNNNNNNNNNRIAKRLT